MICGKMLVALRNGEDVERIVCFLNRIGERPRLHFAMLDFRDIADNRVVKFDHPEPDERFVKGLSEFEFEFSHIAFSAEKMPATAFLEQAKKKQCDSIIVLSSRTDTLFHTDLASTLAAESPIPVLVIQ